MKGQKGKNLGLMGPIGLIGLIAVAAPAQAMTWETAPMHRGKPAMSADAAAAGGHGAADNRGGHAPTGAPAMGMPQPAYLLQDGEGATAVLWSPDLAATPLTLERGQTTPPATGIDYYHLLWAQRLQGDLMETATCWYAAHGKPSGHSPSELTGAVRSGLEVVPDPLPREHWRYQEEKPAAFKVVLDGHPQPGVTVVLKTAQHTTLEARSDAAGRVVFTLPTDLPEPAADGPKSPLDRGPKGVMTVRAETAHENQRYAATLSADYFGGASRDHSLAWGWTGAAGGFALGLVLLARRKVGGEA